MPFQTKLNNKISEVCSVNTVVWWVLWECWEECTCYPQLEEVQWPHITRGSAALAGMLIMPVIEDVLLCHWDNLSNQEELRKWHVLELYGNRRSRQHLSYVVTVVHTTLELNGNSGADDTWAQSDF